MSELTCIFDDQILSGEGRHARQPHSDWELDYRVPYWGHIGGSMGGVRMEWQTAAVRTRLPSIVLLTIPTTWAAAESTGDGVDSDCQQHKLIAACSIVSGQTSTTRNE